MNSPDYGQQDVPAHFLKAAIAAERAAYTEWLASKLDTEGQVDFTVALLLARGWIEPREES